MGPDFILCVSTSHLPGHKHTEIRAFLKFTLFCFKIERKIGFDDFFLITTNAKINQKHKRKPYQKSEPKERNDGH